MTFEELKAALLKLYEFETGKADGVYDFALHRQVRTYVASLLPAEREKTLARIARDAFLSEDALERGSTLENVAEFDNWLWYELLVEEG